MDTLEGTVERITYYNEENGYSVIRLAPTGQISFYSAVGPDGLVTVVGNLPEVAPGESLHLQGQWQTHPRHGRQFQAESVQRITPATVEGIKRYLGSGLIKGIGPRTAEKIVNHFGLDTLDVLDHDPGRLFEVEGVGQHRVKIISRAWVDQQHIKEVMIFLQECNISTGLAVKIYKTYGDRSIPQIRENPYRLAQDVWGIGFKTADRIARLMGLPPDHPRRMEAGVVYTLNQALEDGHLYLPELELVEKATELLEVAPADISAAIDRAAAAELVIRERVPSDGGEPVLGIYLPAFYRSEVGIARRLRVLLDTPTSFLEPLKRHNLALLVTQAAADNGIELSDQQQAAIRAALTEKVSILTGGPGTGKTTTLRTLIHILARRGVSFALASPTGRAAKRLSEATGHAARTIHRLLGYKPTEGFAFDEDNPLPADFVIVDEVSMLDAVLANALIRAVDPRAHLLLVGDVDQLPSVGAGDVLRDLIASGVVPVTQLDVIFRQAEGSLIVTNAHRINRGQMPVFPDQASDFFLFRIADEPERAADLVVDIVQNRIPTRFGLHPLDDVQVIAPMYRGGAGVMTLNERLQQALNPPGRPAERPIAGRLFRVGDKVMQTRNNYDKEVFNGDVGRIHSFDFSEQIMTVLFDEQRVEYDWTEAMELTHAYCISVHRSQGSEYPAVVVPLVIQHYLLLQRNLIYTAITRAKRLVVLVGSTKAIAVAVKNDTVSQRYTALAARLAQG